jgi:hypothetical protein
MDGMTHTLAGALSRLTMAMIEVHERTCEIQPPHRWEGCTSTPGIYGVADGLDLLDAAEFGKPDLDAVVLALHDRECQDSRCTWGSPYRLTHAGDSWNDQAEALLSFAQAEVDQPAPEVSRRGDLMATCQCGHIRRGHSVDGARCYHTPCECAVQGGFRPVTA